MNTRPTGQAWRNWKKSQVRAGHKPADWAAHWESQHGAGSAFTVQTLPAPGWSVDELVEQRIELFRRRRAFEEATRLIEIDIHDDGPIGILHFGDPHVDDDGCDLEALRDHMELVARTPGLFAANIGDTTNNWVGRLARLYGQQSTSAADAWSIAEWFLNHVGRKWLYVLGGNHDAWSGDGDLIKWISEQAGVLHQNHTARMALRFPNGETFTISARHNHPGSSQWNPTHAQMKQALLGIRDDVVISGHKHTSGEGIVKDPETGKVCHCLQVATYKVFDRYGKEAGFRDQAVSPCVLTILDPSKPVGNPNRVTHYWDAEHGAEVLTMLRAQRRAA